MATLVETKRPLACVGDTSAMYMGIVVDVKPGEKQEQVECKCEIHAALIRMQSQQ